jgi:DNA-binding HxlR family transcriptional regulator
MPYRPFEAQECSIARTLAIVGERWTLLVMREVLNGQRRFQDIKRNTGVAANILSDRLNTLVEHGLLRRVLYSEHPESYEYRPTRKGVDLSPALISLMRWGDKYAADESGPPRVVLHTACGHAADARLHCSHCGEPLHANEVRVVDGPGVRDRVAAGSLGP